MDFLKKIETGDVVVGIVGLGYVGLPLAQAFCSAGIDVIGFDVDSRKISLLSEEKSYIKHISDSSIVGMNSNATFVATDNYDKLQMVDVIIICVPTPLSKYKTPDLSAVLSTGKAISSRLKKNHLVILESSTYPGTTDTDLRGILEASGMLCDIDFFLAYSPEREDPGNETFSTKNIPKVVGADSDRSLELAVALYSRVLVEVVPVGSSRTAEAVKLTENIFRSVNIALVNELKVVFEAMDIDVWNVINGAATKPFGFMPFYPGPGLGGHCIPIDPFYLSYIARAYEVPTRFIELAGEINTRMPSLVVNKAVQALNRLSNKSLSGAKVLVMGMAYKKNVDDMRESPSLVLTELMEAEGADVSFFDPYVSTIPPTREHSQLEGRKSITLDEQVLRTFDLVVISTDHDTVDYELVGNNCPLIVDTRNVMHGLEVAAHVIKA